jgi:hypothetical protein
VLLTTLCQHGLARTQVFDRYVGIDYSGAQTAEASLKGLRLFEARRESPPSEVPPPPSPRKYWSMCELAEWLAKQATGEQRIVVGIDHGFSFPRKYFERHHLPLDWEVFLDDFQRHWPTADRYTYVDFVRDGNKGNGSARLGNSRWRRLVEMRVGAKSVFHFDVPGSVAKSTHVGLPWLRHLRNSAPGQVHFWPFDGWKIPANGSVIAEVYPALWSHNFPREGRDSDQHDAYSIAAWLRQADRDSSLRSYFEPGLTPEEMEVAEIEGWILGVR